jgi:ferredoxin
MVETHLERPEISFIPLSTDAGKIRFFGTLMPALLLLKASPARFLHAQLGECQSCADCLAVCPVGARPLKETDPIGA